MRSSHAIAIRLFERLSLDSALIGDLMEECALGRSSTWFWRQVLIALWTGIWNSIRDHKMLSLSAVATGMAAETLLNPLWKFFPHLAWFSPEWWIAGSLFTLLLQIAVGWTVARTHPLPLVPAFQIFILLWSVLYFFSSVERLLLGSIAHPEMRPYLALYVDCVVLAQIGIFAGALWAGRVQRPRPR